MYCCYLCVIKKHTGKGNSVSHSNTAFILEHKDRSSVRNHICNQEFLVLCDCQEPLRGRDTNYKLTNLDCKEVGRLMAASTFATGGRSTRRSFKSKRRSGTTLRATIVLLPLSYGLLEPLEGLLGRLTPAWR